jgi:hypothetical protein
MKRTKTACQRTARKTTVPFMEEAVGWAGDLAGVLEEEGGVECGPEATAEGADRVIHHLTLQKN